MSLCNCLLIIHTDVIRLNNLQTSRNEVVEKKLHNLLWQYIIYNLTGKYSVCLCFVSQMATVYVISGSWFTTHHKWRLYTPFPVPVWRPKQISTPFWIIILFSYGLIRITIALTNIINSINVVNTYYNWDFISGWIEEKSLLYPLLLTSS
jgi:hypothetical protein